MSALPTIENMSIWRVFADPVTFYIQGTNFELAIGSLRRGQVGKGCMYVEGECKQAHALCILDYHYTWQTGGSIAAASSPFIGHCSY